MTITIPELDIQIRSYGGGPCLQLFELVTNRTGKDGEPLPDSWRSCGVYPSTLLHALSMVRERALRRSRTVGSLEDAIRELTAMDAAMRSALEPLLGRSAGR